MSALARSRSLQRQPLAAKRGASPTAAGASNSENQAALGEVAEATASEGSIWDAVAASVGEAAGAPPADTSGGGSGGGSPAGGGSAGGGGSTGGTASGSATTKTDAEEAKKKAELAAKKHEHGDYGPDTFNPVSLTVNDVDYVGAYDAWKANKANARAAAAAESHAAMLYKSRMEAREQAAAKAALARQQLSDAERKASRDNDAAAAKLVQANADLEKATKREAEARTAHDEATSRRKKAEVEVDEAKTKVLKRAKEIDLKLPKLRDDEARTREPLDRATSARERADQAVEKAQKEADDTEAAGRTRVNTLKDAAKQKQKAADDAEAPLNTADENLKTARKNKKDADEKEKGSWFDLKAGKVERKNDVKTLIPRRPNSRLPDVEFIDKEATATGLKIGGRDRARATAKLEVNKAEFNRDVKTSYGSGGAIETKKGFQGDIPDTHKARAAGATAAAGEGADGVFFESTRGKNQTAANGQAFAADAGATAGAVAKGGDWFKGDTLGVHAQAKARAAALGVSASANAAAEGGPALGGIDPRTGQRRGMASAEAGVDADIRLLEAGVSGDAQASVQGTRAQASVDAAADLTLARASGGIGGKAGVELGGWKMAGVQADASGSAAVTARGSASLGAEVGLSGIKAKAAGEAMIGAEAQGQAQAQATLLGVDQKIGASGRAMAGVEASGEVGGGLNVATGDAFVKAQGEAFAGAKAEGSAQMGFGLGDMDLVTMSIHGSALAGAGISGTFLAGMVDGAFEFFAEASAALGVGLGAGFGMNVGVFVPVKYALQLLNDNGVISNDPDDWIPQMVELAKTGKVLRSQQQGTDGWAKPDAAPAAPATPPPASTMPVGMPAIDFGPPGRGGSNAGSSIVTSGGAPALAPPDLGALPPEQAVFRRFAEPRGEAESIPGDLPGPMSAAGMTMLARPGSFDLDQVAKVADQDEGFGELAIEIEQTRAVLEKEMAPLADLEDRWLEGFNDEASEMVDGLASPLQSLWGLVDTAIGGISELLSGDLGGVLAAGQGLIEGAGQMIAGGWALLEQAFTDPIGAIRGFFAKFDGLRAGAEAVFGGLLGGMSSMTDLFEGRIGPARALSGMIRGMAQGILDILIDHGHEAAEDVRAVGDKADKVLDKPVDGQKLPGVTLDLDDRARASIDEDADRIEDIGDDASGKVLGAIDQAADHVDGYIAQAVDFAGKLVTDAIGGARRVFDNIKNAVVSQIANAQSNLLVKAAQIIAERIAAAARAIAAFFGWG